LERLEDAHQRFGAGIVTKEYLFNNSVKIMFNIFWGKFKTFAFLERLEDAHQHIGAGIVGKTFLK